VETALAEALRGATAAGEWSVVAQLARELEARRAAKASFAQAAATTGTLEARCEVGAVEQDRAHEAVALEPALSDAGAFEEERPLVPDEPAVRDGAPAGPRRRPKKAPPPEPVRDPARVSRTLESLRAANRARRRGGDAEVDSPNQQGVDRRGRRSKG
jgi:hypothetical protein